MHLVDFYYNKIIYFPYTLKPIKMRKFSQHEKQIRTSNPQRI